MYQQITRETDLRTRGVFSLYIYYLLAKPSTCQKPVRRDSFFSWVLPLFLALGRKAYEYLDVTEPDNIHLEWLLCDLWDRHGRRPLSTRLLLPCNDKPQWNLACRVSGLCVRLVSEQVQASSLKLSLYNIV